MGLASDYKLDDHRVFVKKNGRSRWLISGLGLWISTLGMEQR